VKKTEQKFPATSPGKNCPSQCCFLKIFRLEARPVEGQTLQQTEKKRRKRKLKK